MYLEIWNELYFIFCRNDFVMSLRNKWVMILLMSTETYFFISMIISILFSSKNLGKQYIISVLRKGGAPFLMKSYHLIKKKKKITK